MIKSLKVLVPLAIAAPLLLGFSLEVVPADIRYPFSTWGTSWPEPMKVAYSQLNMVRWAVDNFVDANNRLPASWEELAGSEYASYLRLWNGYQGRAAKVYFLAPPAEEDLSAFYGDIFAVPTLVGTRQGLELRTYVPPDPEKGSYLWAKPTTVGANPGQRRWNHIMRRQGRELRDRVVSLYCDRLRSAAASAALTIVPPVHTGFGAGLSLKELEEFWWLVAPSSIINPYTGEPIREVSLENATPGEVTFLPVQLNLDPVQWFKGPSEFRPSSYPLRAVVICYDGNSQPIYPEELAFAARLRPSHLPPIPETLER